MSQRQVEGDRASGRRWKFMSAAVAVATALGLFNACNQQTIGPRQAGDEPPIRVRSGSLELKLLTASTNDFEIDPPSPPPNPPPEIYKDWKIKSGTRGKPEYEVFIHATDMTKCKSNYVTTNRIVFGYGTATTESQKVVVHVTGRNTKINGDKELTHETQDGKFLRYHVQNEFIRRIGIRGDDEFCTFGEEDKGLKVVLIDPITDDK